VTEQNAFAATELGELPAVKKILTRTSQDSHMDRMAGLLMSGLYMMSVLVAAAAVAGDSPWVTGVEEAGIRGSTTPVVVSAGDILDSYFLAGSWTQKTNQEMEESVVVVAASGVSQRL